MYACGLHNNQSKEVVGTSNPLLGRQVDTVAGTITLPPAASYKYMLYARVLDLAAQDAVLCRGITNRMCEEMHGKLQWAASMGAIGPVALGGLAAAGSCEAWQLPSRLPGAVSAVRLWLRYIGDGTLPAVQLLWPAEWERDRVVHFLSDASRRAGGVWIKQAVAGGPAGQMFHRLFVGLEGELDIVELELLMVMLGGLHTGIPLRGRALVWHTDSGPNAFAAALGRSTKKGGRLRAMLAAALLLFRGLGCHFTCSYLPRERNPECDYASYEPSFPTLLQWCRMRGIQLTSLAGTVTPLGWFVEPQ
jgi:hypothetical protein